MQVIDLWNNKYFSKHKLALRVSIQQIPGRIKLSIGRNKNWLATFYFHSFLSSESHIVYYSLPVQYNVTIDKAACKVDTQSAEIITCITGAVQRSSKAQVIVTTPDSAHAIYVSCLVTEFFSHAVCPCDVLMI